MNHISLFSLNQLKANSKPSSFQAADKCNLGFYLQGSIHTLKKGYDKTCAAPKSKCVPLSTIICLHLLLLRFLCMAYMVSSRLCYVTIEFNFPKYDA